MEKKNFEFDSRPWNFSNCGGELARKMLASLTNLLDV